MTASKKMIIINISVSGILFILNFFYQSNDFNFSLKCICSGLFALLGIVNAAYALKKTRMQKSIQLIMAAGLILAMLGDVLIAFDFITGAASFALGHLCFVTAYCLSKRICVPDLTISGVLFLGALLFLLFCPLLSFNIPIFRAVCIVYALIISFMLGKATGNFLKNRSFCNALIFMGSLLFFFSDVMLLLDWFIGLWNWTDHACMGTYYPALCLMAFSMLFQPDTATKH